MVDPETRGRLEALLEPLRQGGGVFEGLHSADAAFLFSFLARTHEGPLLWLCRNNRQADQVVQNLSFFLGSEREVVLVPGAEADPYRGLSPHPEIAARRALAFWKLARGFDGFVVTTVASLLTRTPDPARFLESCLDLEVGDSISPASLRRRLLDLGYVREDPVEEAGEYSSRGGIVDLFSPAHSQPVRIEFFGDEVESMRHFDPASQRSTGLIHRCEVTPMREVPLERETLRRWGRQAARVWGEPRFARALEEKLGFASQGEPFNGFEYLLPLVFEYPHHLLHYLPGVRLVASDSAALLEEAASLWEHFQESFRSRLEEGEPALEPERLFLEPAWLGSLLEKSSTWRLEALSPGGASHHYHFQPERRYQGRIQDLLADLKPWLSRGERVLFVMASRGMADRITDILREYELGVHWAEGGVEESFSHPLSVAVGRLSEGFYSPALGLHLICQDQLFAPAGPRPRPKTQGEVAARFLSDLRDLKEGDYVVHLDHGIGLFRGLKKIGVERETREFVELGYRNGARLYVPVDRLDLIQKYCGAGQAHPQIDRLGGTSWERTKKRIRKSMQVLAEDLLRLYARREVAEGYAFPPDDDLDREFAEAFEFEETEDQLGAIHDVKSDMESHRPMDRLVCGDVGYGKTEVAMRAAFKAIKESKQVVLLAPTTVLALQHYNTLRERFQGFPVEIGMVSRLQGRRRQKEILERAALGQVDLVVGTHRLLSADVQFHDLGLIIIDEEQRFGVSQKERLKRLKTQVDVLSLSATPIPRTLNMAMIGVRDLSIIETPPKDRLAIQTAVVRFSRAIIASAIELELKREGQVLFVHNSIDTIYSIAEMVQQIVPRARVGVAHGQMEERRLEQVMVDFIEYRTDVLVATTIIENGLDIARANTLIVNRAHCFGLAQLYQLRGRVGRSNRRAYAYLLVPSEENLSRDAARRLAAIREFSELGAGFRLAAMDLEIRGAGNLLGAQQHGHINAVGFELYLKLLEQAIRELKGEEVMDEVDTAIDLGMDIQIPEHYIDDPSLRLWLYKRISSAVDEAAIDKLESEVVDRFGQYPRAVVNLFQYARLRAKARRLKILSLEKKGWRLLLRFRPDTPVSREHVVSLVASTPALGLSPEGVLTLELAPRGPQAIIEAAHSLLEQVAVLE